MTVLKYILAHGDDENFKPQPCSGFRACHYPAGSPEKVAAMALRVSLGCPLWHPEDNPLVAQRSASGDGPSSGRATIRVLLSRGKTLSE